LNRTKYLQGPCAVCGTVIRFPAESIGQVATCPHCKKATELRLGTPGQESVLPRKALVWAAVAVLILAGGLAGSIAALKRAQRWAARQHQAAAGFASNRAASAASPVSEPASAPLPFGLQASAVRLEKEPDGLFVQGLVSNQSNQRHSGIEVEIGLFDAAGVHVGSATAYRQSIGPWAQWRFKVPAPAPTAVTAKVASLHEGH
jgi:hypothetical protein